MTGLPHFFINCPDCDNTGRRPTPIGPAPVCVRCGGLGAFEVDADEVGGQVVYLLAGLIPLAQPEGASA